MEPSPGKRLLLIILSFFLVIFLVLIAFFIYLRTHNAEFVIINSHPSLQVKKNSSFKFGHLDKDTQAFLAENEIKSIQLEFTPNTTTQTLSEYNNQEELINYIGSDAQLEEQVFKVTVFVNPNALFELDKDESAILFDSLQQVFVAVNIFQLQNRNMNGDISADLYEQEMKSIYPISAVKADELIKSGITPYQISHQLND